MRKIAVVTVGRSDYGIYRPLLRAIQNEQDLELSLYISGMHLSPIHGSTYKQVEADGYKIADRIDMLLANDTPEAIAKSMGLGVMGFAASFARWRPDILVLLGDRFEMHSAALAALPFMIPIAHLHGGETTEGAMDESLRHSITKLSHLHFPATESYSKRIMAMGEEPWRVTVSGAPSLDNLNDLVLPTREELEKQYSLDLSIPTLLVTYHPVTLEFEQMSSQIKALFDALAQSGMPVVFSAPNADTGGSAIREAITDFLRSHPDSKLVENFGVRNYFGMLQNCIAMVGNSSSGLIEAPSFELPVVNIGVRQRGRVRGQNVIDTENDPVAILAGIKKATSAEFRGLLKGVKNPYGDGHASGRIVEKLKSARLDENLLLKRFYDGGN